MTTMREKAIEAAAKAIEARQIQFGWDEGAPMGDCPEHWLAIAALDAILSELANPDAAIVEAMAHWKGQIERGHHMMDEATAFRIALSTLTKEKDCG